MLSASVAEEKAVTNHSLLNILYCIQYLSWQGCAFRGHDDGQGTFSSYLSCCQKMIRGLVANYLDNNSNIKSWL